MPPEVVVGLLFCGFVERTAGESADGTVGFGETIGLFLVRRVCFTLVVGTQIGFIAFHFSCLLYTSPSPRD